jgi:hypothetical protein
VPPLTAARCSVQIGRTGSDPAQIFSQGSILVGAIVQMETGWAGLPLGSLRFILPAIAAHQCVGIPVGIGTKPRQK